MHHLQRVNNFLIGARMDAGLLRIHFAFHVVWAGEDALLRLLLLAQICASRPVTLSAILQSLSGLEGTRVASHETIHLLLLLLASQGFLTEALGVHSLGLQLNTARRRVQ